MNSRARNEYRAHGHEMESLGECRDCRAVEFVLNNDDYDALKALGLSGFKAAEVVLDAGRGDAYARGWIRQARAQAGMSA